MTWLQLLSNKCNEVIISMTRARRGRDGVSQLLPFVILRVALIAMCHLRVRLRRYCRRPRRCKRPNEIRLIRSFVPNVKFGVVKLQSFVNL